MLKFGRNSYFLFLISALIVTALVILLDVPVLRQIFGFIFLTFVPGFFFLYILRLNRLDLIDKIVLSMGLSVAFLMLFGLLVNITLPALGYSRPLSTISLLISFSATTIVLAIFGYIRYKGVTFTLSLSDFKLTIREKAYLILPSLFPLLSISGMRIMNLTDNNVLLMLLLFLIPAYVIFIAFYNRRVSDKVYPFAIFLIGISLLLMYSLRANHIIDGDTAREYFMFLTTLDNLHWSQLGFGNLDACLSITLMPAIYQAYLNINPEFLFKLIFSVMASVLPIIVYLLAKKYIGSFYAFLVSVFFMSQIAFLQTPTYTRVTVAILFFTLAIWTLFHDSINELHKRMLFFVFTASLIVSHYGVTFTSFFVLLLTWIGIQVLLRIVYRREELTTAPDESPITEQGPQDSSLQGGSPQQSYAIAAKSLQTRFRSRINITTVFLFLAMLFLWHSQVTESSFGAGVRLIYQTFASSVWFLAREAADQPIQAAFGKVYTYTGVPQRIEFFASWLTIIFIATGVFTTVIKFKSMVSTTDNGQKKPDLLLKKFEPEYLMLSIASCSLLVATVILPVISQYYGSSRTYFQMMISLSVFFVIGGIVISRYLKLRPYWVILAVLIPYFLSTTGAITQVFGFPRTITLNSEGPLYSRFIFDGETYAAKWLGEYGEEGVTIYTTGHAQDLLLSQGRIPYLRTDHTLIERCEEGRKMGGYIYLEYLLLGDDGLVAQYPNIFTEKGKIYSSGKSEIYK